MAKQNMLDKKRLYQETYDYIEKKYEERPDKDNMYGVVLSDAEFRMLIIREFLGKDWYVVDPLGHNQINEIAFYNIVKRYAPKLKGKGVKTR